MWFKKTKNILNVFSELYKNRNELRKNAVFVEFFTIFVKLNIDSLLSDKIKYITRSPANKSQALK